MSEDKRPKSKPQGQPKDKGSSRPLKIGNFGESKAQQDQLRKAAEIPPRPTKPNKKDK